MSIFFPNNGGGSFPLSADELSAIHNAENPSAENPFVTREELGSSDQLSADEIRAIKGANAPSASNPVATAQDVADVAEDASMRLGAVEATSRPLGGVSMVAASSASVSNCGFELRMGISVTTATLCADLYLDALATGVTGVFGTTSATTSDDEHVWSASVYAEALGWLVSNPRTEYTASCENLIGKRARLAWIVDGATITCWANGTRLEPINTTQTLAWGRLKAFLTAQQFLGNVGGVVLKSAIYNRALTDDELTDYFSQGVAAGDRWGRSVTSSGWFTYNPDNVILSDVTDTSFTAEVLAAGYVFVQGAWTSVYAKIGQTLRVRCKVRLISGDAANLPGVFFRSGSSIFARSAARLVEGDNIVDCVVYSGAADLAPHFGHHASLWPNAGGSVKYEIYDVQPVELLGCVASYTPDTLSLNGRWRDESANANDATVRDLAKITPLSPRVQTRVIPVAWPTTSIPANSGQNVLLTAANAGAIAAIQAGDALTWCQGSTKLADGLWIKDIRASSAGNVQLAVLSRNAATTATGANSGAIIHTIN